MRLAKLLYGTRRRDVLWDHPWLASGRRPVLCPEHISKTILVMVMDFCRWIDLIKVGGAVHMNLNSCLLNF